MSRLLWFILGGITTAVGTGVAAFLMDEETPKAITSDEDKAPLLPEEADCTEVDGNTEAGQG